MLACVAGGILLPGVPFWRRSRHARRGSREGHPNPATYAGYRNPNLQVFRDGQSEKL